MVYGQADETYCPFSEGGEYQHQVQQAFINAQAKAGVIYDKLIESMSKKH